MMCDNLALYKSLPRSTNMNAQFYPEHNDDNEHRSYASVKRKLTGLYPLTEMCEESCREERLDLAASVRTMRKLLFEVKSTILFHC